MNPNNFQQGGPPGGFPGGGPGGPRGGMLLGGPGLFGFLPMLFTLLMLVIMAVAFWQILRKAGFPGPLGLLMLVPGVNLVVALWAAFAEWPALAKLRELEAVVATAEAERAEAAIAASAAPAADAAAPVDPSVAPSS